MRFVSARWLQHEKSLFRSIEFSLVVGKNIVAEVTSVFFQAYLLFFRDFILTNTDEVLI